MKIKRKTNTSKRVAAAAKKQLKKAKKEILQSICIRIHQESQKNKGKVPYGFISALVFELKDVCNGTLGRDAINYSYRSFLKNCKSVKLGSISPTLSHMRDEYVGMSYQPSGETSREKGGRPKGTTNEAKYQKELAIAAALNEITALYVAEKEQNVGKRMKRGRVEEIISDIQKKENFLQIQSLKLIQS